jgi:hypothetical protein
MARYAKLVGVVAIGWSIALSHSTQAADKPGDLIRRLSQLRDRAQATQPVATPVHRPGDAVVTGFSGIRPPPQFPPGVNPLDKTFIDLDGPSVRVIDLSNPGAPPQGQVMAAPKPFTVTAAQVGQVFAVAQDDAAPPNIYVAATSGYGLPIVAAQPDRDGTPRRLRRGEPGARFMPGLFGPPPTGGPGSIWKIDGSTGVVSLFADIPNSGAGLGDIAYDTAHRQFFVSDRASGLIYRIGPDGVVRDAYDHGTTGRGIVGLVPVPDNPQRRLNIQNPAFDPGNPQSWNLPPPARRTFGLAIFKNRLLYAIAEGPQVWSVALTPDGGFGDSAAWELSARPSPRPLEIASIMFDQEAQLYLAERGAPTGAYDFKALAAPGQARVLRYRLRQPDDPPGPGRWAPVPDEYAVGLRPNHRNTNGGLALGYHYTETNTFGACGGTLWTTGEQLRAASDPALARQLAASGPVALNGVQGTALEHLRPLNVPPQASLFARYDDRIPELVAREQFGHMGDIAIWQSCGAPPPLLVLTCPDGFYWNGFTQSCEAPFIVVAGCPPGQHWDGRRCRPTVCRGGQRFDGRRCVCPPGTEWNGKRCLPPRRVCPEGQIWDGERCVPAPRCPPGQSWDGQACACPPGQEGTDGACKCPPGEYWDGKSCQPSNGLAPTPPPGVDCPPGQVCVPPGQPGDRPLECPPGQILRNGTCIVVDPAPPAAGACQFPDVLLTDGTCCKFGDYQAGRCGPSPPVQPPRTITCPPGTAKVCRGDSPDETVDCGCTPTPPPPPTPPPTTGDCTPADQLRGTCVQAPPTPVAGRCQASGDQCCASFSGSTLCTPSPAGGCPQGSTCCTRAERRLGICRVRPPAPTAPPDPPGSAEFCPFNVVGGVGGTCCSPTNVPVVCNRRLPGAGCGSFGVPVELDGASLCCKPDPTGSCVAPPPSAAPSPDAPPTFDVTNPPSKCGLWVWVPIVGFICEIWPDLPAAGECRADTDCAVGMSCREGVCLDVPPLPNAACPPPAIVVNGSCCAPEAVAAGACGPVRLTACTGDKVFRDSACRCPEGTTEDVATGKCDKPPPVTAPATKKRPACKPGFHREGSRCVRNVRPRASDEPSGPAIGIEIGPGFGGGGRRGGGRAGGGGGRVPAIGGGGGRVPAIGGGGGRIPRGGGVVPR